MGKPLNVLMVEDSEQDAELLLHALRKGGYDPQAERVETPAAMAAALNAKTWDIIIADHALPQFNATMALTLLKKAAHDIPFIIVSGSIGEDIAVAAMKLGAHDYIMKGQPDASGPGDRTRAARSRGPQGTPPRRKPRVQHQAYYDLLTDLPNRTMFNDRVTLALAHANRYRNMLAVLFVDLDRFKNIIDTLGPAVGDRLLQGVAERLSSTLEEGDTLARLGGDEFVILLPHIQRADKAVKLALSRCWKC